MAGNRAIYEQAMNTGHGAAWDLAWDQAASAYARAIQEFPEDPSAHNSLGLALLQMKRYPEALKIYERAVRLNPDDPVPLEKSADVLERLGQLQEAAQRYVAVAEIYLGQQRDIDKAIGNWERATRLTPGMLSIHFKLAQAYERTGQKRSAVREYLTLAFNFQRSGDKQKALQAAERAKRLEPTSPQVLNSIQAIQSDALMVVPEFEDEGGGTARSTTETTAVGKGGAVRFGKDGGEAHIDGPVGEDTEKALAILAEEAFGDLSPATTHVVQAIELHKISENQAAIDSYLRAEKAGMKNPAMYMCIGALLVKLQKWQDSVKYFERVKDNADYKAGAAHGLGHAMMGLNKPREAATHLISALRQADMELAMSPDEADQLNAVYNTLLKSTQNKQDTDLNAMNQQFVKWLSGPDWKVRVAETRRLLGERLATEGEDAVIDYVGDKETVDMVTQIDRHIRQGLLTLAMDEAFRAIESEPTFLPVHQRIAQILMEEGRTQAAITKYNMIANSFLARDDTHRAAEILNEVIALAPMDINLRMSLIELLEKEQQWDKILDEYSSLADSYYQLADLEQARTTYQEALRLAQRINASAEKRANIMHKMADIELSRLDLRQALRTYEQIRNLNPDDEKARRSLVDLNYRLNNSLDAVKELDGLLRLFAQQKRGDQIVGLLEQMVTNMPNDMALRSRLAAVYRQTNRRDDAIAQLDALGELQLEAGLYQDACATIKQILSLQPSDIEQYKSLLTQLGCA
jgi:tetratricopeptide (TPR) repeat protein